MKQRVEIGKIVKPQGIKGEVKVFPYVDDLQPFTRLKSVYMDGRVVEIVRARLAGSDVFLLLQGVSDRNAAELLRGKVLSLPFEEAKAFAEDGYLVDELIGMRVVANGRVLGEIAEVLKNGAADVFVVKGERSFMVPFLKKVTLSVNTASREIVFDEQALQEVIVYED